MTLVAPRPVPLLRDLRAALAARSEEIAHASALGRRNEVLEDICVQLLHETLGIVADWNDPRLKALLRECVRHLDRR